MPLRHFAAVMLFRYITSVRKALIFSHVIMFMSLRSYYVIMSGCSH